MLADPAIDAVAICSHHRHARRLIAEAAAPASTSSARSRSTSTWRASTRALAAVEQAGVKLQIGFNRRFDPNFRRVRELVADGRDRRAAPRAHHHPRPGAAAARLRQGLGRHLPRHDHPRLRHGALPDRQRGRGGLRAGGGAGRPGHRRGRRRRHGGGHADASPTAPWAPSTTAARPSTATTSGSRSSARRACARRGNNTPTTRRSRRREGVHGDKPLYFFLERYTDAYVAEMRAFCRLRAQRTRRRR